MSWSAARPSAEPSLPVTEMPALHPVAEADERRFRRNESARVPWQVVKPYLGLYRVAGRTFGVNWLLIASVHKEETAFSTHPDTYSGLNFARCCAGPMQFNVTNGRVSTWDLVKGAYRSAPRPAAYPHATPKHPSVYDDFDAIMAAASLLRAGGAGLGLDGRAWHAAYGYYGHDMTGIHYANQVVARAVTWRRGGFCPSCPTDPAQVAAFAAAFGRPAAAELAARERFRSGRPRQGDRSARRREGERRAKARVRRIRALLRRRKARARRRDARARRLRVRRRRLEAQARRRRLETRARLRERRRHQRAAERKQRRRRNRGQARRPAPEQAPADRTPTADETD